MSSRVFQLISFHQHALAYSVAEGAKPNEKLIELRDKRQAIKSSLFSHLHGVSCRDSAPVALDFLINVNSLQTNEEEPQEKAEGPKSKVLVNWGLLRCVSMSGKSGRR